MSSIVELYTRHRRASPDKQWAIPQEHEKIGRSGGEGRRGTSLRRGFSLPQVMFLLSMRIVVSHGTNHYGVWGSTAIQEPHFMLDNVLLTLLSLYSSVHSAHRQGAQ